jgi:predicted nucleic acid-binding protein
MSSTAVVDALSGWNESIADMNFDDKCNLLGDFHSVSTLVRSMELDVIAGLANNPEKWMLHDYLCIHLGLTRSEAKQRVEVAMALPSLPACREAFRNGELDWARLVLVVQLAETSEDDSLYAATARDYSLNQLRVLVQRKKTGDVEASEKAHKERSLRIRHDDKNQKSTLTASFPLDLGIAIENVLQQRADTFGIDQTTNTYSRPEQNMADALCDLLFGEQGPRAEILIDAEAAALIGNGEADLQGHKLTKETLQRLACDGSARITYVDDKGLPISLGRKVRLFPDYLSRQLRHRDRGCRFPGCGQTRWIHDHHMLEWEDEEGPTDYSNGVQLCGTHHRFLHEGKWKIKGNPDEALTFIRPDGKEFTGLPPLIQTELQTPLFAMATNAAERLALERELVEEQANEEALVRWAEMQADLERQHQRNIEYEREQERRAQPPAADSWSAA